MLQEVPSHVVDLAAFPGDTSVLQYLHDVAGLDVSTPRAMYHAAQCGHFHIVRYLYELNNQTNVLDAATAAAHCGHLDVIEFFHIHCASCDLRSAFISAVDRQDLVVAQFILDLVGKDTLDELYVVEYAAAKRNMTALEWLHQRGFACSTDAMDFAAENGHLDVVQWLHANRSEGCTKLAMHEAAVHGHLDVVEFLFFNRHERCYTVEETAQCGHWHIVRCLVTHGVPSLAVAS